MIIFLGDTHGNFEVFSWLREKLGDDPDVSIIQVGDFGIWPGWEKKWNTTPWPVYFIDGNHEHFPMLDEAIKDGIEWGVKCPTKMAENLYYMPRGTIHILEGIRFGFMGGGESIDQKWRVLGQNWFHEERLERHHVEEFIKDVNKTPIDMLVSHVPPISVRDALFPPLNYAEWQLDLSWVDVSMYNMEILWQLLNRIPMVCGHMHRSLRWHNCRILDINEAYTLENVHANAR